MPPRSWSGTPRKPRKPVLHGSFRAAPIAGAGLTAPWTWHVVANKLSSCRTLLIFQDFHSGPLFSPVKLDLEHLAQESSSANRFTTLHLRASS